MQPLTLLFIHFFGWGLFYIRFFCLFVFFPLSIPAPLRRWKTLQSCRLNMTSNLLSNTFWPNGLHWKILCKANCVRHESKWSEWLWFLFSVKQIIFLSNALQDAFLSPSLAGQCCSNSSFNYSFYGEVEKQSKTRLYISIVAEKLYFVFLCSSVPMLGSFAVLLHWQHSPTVITEELYVPCGEFPLVIWRYHNKCFYGAIYTERANVLQGIGM